MQLAQDGFTPLHVAASVGNVSAIDALLQEGVDVDVNAVDLQGRTPLHVAAEKGHVKACRRLKVSNHSNARAIYYGII